MLGGFSVLTTGIDDSDVFSDSDIISGIDHFVESDLFSTIPTTTIGDSSDIFTSDDDACNDIVLTDSTLSDLVTEDSKGNAICFPISKKVSSTVREERKQKREKRLSSKMSQNTSVGEEDSSEDEFKEPESKVYRRSESGDSSSDREYILDQTTSDEGGQYSDQFADEKLQTHILQNIAIEDEREVPLKDFLEDVDKTYWRKYEFNNEIADDTVSPQTPEFFASYKLPEITFTTPIASCFDLNFDSLCDINPRTKHQEKLLFNRLAQMIYTCVNTVASKGALKITCLQSIFEDVYGIPMKEFKKLTNLDFGSFLKHPHCKPYFKIYWDNEIETFLINEGDEAFKNLRFDITSLRRDNALLHQRKMGYLDKTLLEIDSSESVLHGKIMILELANRCAGDVFELIEFQENFEKLYGFPFNGTFLKKYFVRSKFAKVIKYHLTEVFEIIDLPNQPIKIKKLCNMEEYLNKCKDKLNYMKSDKYRTDLAKSNIMRHKFNSDKKVDVGERKSNRVRNTWDISAKEVFGEGRPRTTLVEPDSEQSSNHQGSKNNGEKQINFSIRKNTRTISFMEQNSHQYYNDSAHNKVKLSKHMETRVCISSESSSEDEHNSIKSYQNESNGNKIILNRSDNSFIERDQEVVDTKTNDSSDFESDEEIILTKKYLSSDFESDEEMIPPKQNVLVETNVKQAYSDDDLFSSSSSQYSID
uniref:DDE_Tnp_1_7 domain-containing protein n=1 Tax=Rhabditophanes sp. KR3021 TaxID=114890 RepID=A0AC35UHT5_9BILA